MSDDAPRDGSPDRTNSRRTEEEDDWRLVPEQVRVDTRRAAAGGVLAAVVTLIGAWVVGEASGVEAYVLLETSLPSTRSFCGTLTLALGNILALMLTLLSLSAGSDVDLKWDLYQRVKQISWVVTIVLIVSTLIYLLLNVPLTEADKAAEQVWPGYGTLYYASLALSSLLAGAFIAVVLMLYNTVRDVIQAIGPTEHDHLVRSEE